MSEVKVGDKFVVVHAGCGFKEGEIVTFNRGRQPAEHGNAVFAGPNSTWNNAYDEHEQRIPGAWMDWKDVKPYVEPVKTDIEEKVDMYRGMYMAGLGFAVAGLQEVCYNASVQAGWWTDIKTGEAKDPVALGPEKIALMHSELSEALEGLRKNQMDDKLPHRPMAEVELADCIIRALDWAGAMGYDVGGAIVEKLEFNASRADHKIENRLKDDGKKF